MIVVIIIATSYTLDVIWCGKTYSSVTVADVMESYKA